MKKNRNGISTLLILALSLSLGAAHSAQAASNKEKLGELLYFDKWLSIHKNQACASCHTPPNFVDPANVADPVNSVVSAGSDPTLHGGRNAPSAGYAAFTPPFAWDPARALYVGGQFWDGRASRLADQAKGPFLNPVEMAMPSKAAVLARIADERNPNNDRYRKLFDRVYKVDIEKFRAARRNPPPADPVYDLVADAIAAFESTALFSPFDSKFDQFMAGKVQLTAAELSGLALFNGKAGCAACHSSSTTTAADGTVTPPLFTDFTYDNIGIPKSSHPLLASNPVDNGLGGRADIAAADPTGNEIGKFKVMTLRNIAVTAPYGHNGFFATLEDIVHFYNTRDVPAANWPPAEVLQNMNSRELGNLGLSAQEEADLVAFLKTLTDGHRP
jgi:cytochrome c peroxidase